MEEDDGYLQLVKAVYDMSRNYLGRHQNRVGLYSNARDACAFFRKDKTDERY